MRSKRVILHRAAFVFVGLVAFAAFSGCSSVEPTDAWDEATGRVSGTVRSETGSLLGEIEVCVWGELGEEGLEVWHQTVTDEYGAFEFEAVELATEQSSETTYSIGANRTPIRSDALDTDYSSCCSMVTVPRGGTCTSDMVLDETPGDPEAYIDE